MLSRSEAIELIQQHLDDSPRAAHSLLVGALMRQLAEHFTADSDPGILSVGVLVSERGAAIR